MKRIDVFFPLIADAISGAFGGAMLGDWFSGSGNSSTSISAVTLIAAASGAAVVLIHGMRSIRKERNQRVKS